MEHDRGTWVLNVTTVKVSGGIVIAARGRVAAANAPVLAAALTSAAAESNRIVFDLEGVDYISGAGIGALEEAARGGLEVILCGLREPVRITLELGGLLELIPTEPTRPDAVARLSGTTASERPAPRPRSS